jgi:hypothetical protein
MTTEVSNIYSSRLIWIWDNTDGWNWSKIVILESITTVRDIVRIRPKLHKEIEKLNLAMVNDSSRSYWNWANINRRNLEGFARRRKVERDSTNKTNDFVEDSQGTVGLGNWICVPNLKHIRELILREEHDSAYSIYHSSTKMYQNLNTRYWWYGMICDVVEYVALCDICQRVKVEHQKFVRLL